MLTKFFISLNRFFQRMYRFWLRQGKSGKSAILKPFVDSRIIEGRLLVSGEKVWFRTSSGSWLRAKVMSPNGYSYHLRRSKHRLAPVFTRSGDELRPSLLGQ